MFFLNEIIKHKKSEIVSTKKSFPLVSFKSELRDSELDFKSAISKSGLNIIAEIKKASPSQGIIRRDFNYVDIARVYAECNVSAISVLTEKKYFQGDISFLREIKLAVKNIPLLRKDFIIDDYQIYESRYYNADAILLIAGLLDRKEIRRFISIAKEYSMGCLVEVHNGEELENAIESDAEIIGINNRDLNTFRINKSTTERLIKIIPKNKIIVAESGYETKEEIEKLKGKVNAVLIGTSLMKEKDIKAKLMSLM